MNHLMPMAGSLSLMAAFVAGLAGSVHCLAMCGGLSGALTLRVRSSGASSRRTVVYSVIHQAGRLSSYAVAGALVAAVFGVAPALLKFQSLGLVLRALAGLVLIAAAVSLLFESRPLVPLERLGARWWHHIAPLAHRLPANRIANSYLLGMLWGWLPCGMVYSILLVAALSGTAANGAATMLCFGIGTLPAVLSAGLASAQVLRLRSGPRLNVVFGLLLLGFGILTVVAPWAMPFQLHMNMAM